MFSSMLMHIAREATRRVMACTSQVPNGTAWRDCTWRQGCKMDERGYRRLSKPAVVGEHTRTRLTTAAGATMDLSGATSHHFIPGVAPWASNVGAVSPCLRLQ